VLETRLAGRDWIMGKEYTIADVATFAWVNTVGAFYGAGEIVGLDKMPRVNDWLARALARPASQKAMNIPPRP
jgi:GST-like protein